MIKLFGNKNIKNLKHKMIILFFIIFISSFFEDILKLININLSIFNDSIFISQNFLILIVTILSILFAIYFLMIQIYRNRFPLDLIEVFFKTYLSDISLHFFLNIFVGISLIVIDIDFVFTKLVYTIHVIYCIFLFIKFCMNYKLFNISEIINSYKESIIERINNGNIKNEELIKYIRDLKQFAEESFSKNEVTLIKHILYTYKDLLIYFIKNKDKLVLEREDYTSKNILEIEERIFSGIINLSNLSVNYHYVNMLEETFHEIKHILFICIDCDKVDTFNNYAKMLDNFFSFNIFRKNSEPSTNVVFLYGDLVNYTFEKDVRAEWLNLLCEKFKYYSFASNVQVDESVLKALFHEYYLFLDKCLEAKKFDLYLKLLEDLFILYNSSIKEKSNRESNFIQVLALRHINTLIVKKNNKLLEEYLIKLKKITRNSNKEFCLFLLYVIDFIDDNCDENFKEMIMQFKQEISIDLIYYEDDLAMMFVPDYSQYLIKNNYKFDKVTIVYDNYYEILQRAILKKKNNLILYLLNTLKETILIFDISQRQQQEKLLNLYDSCLDLCISIKSAESFHIVLESFSILITDLDDENKISEILGKKILEILRYTSTKCIIEKQFDFAISINGLLKSLQKHDFIKTKKPLYYMLIKIIFNIGLDGIENDAENVVRNISNHLGWIGSHAIKNKEADIFKSVVDYAVILTNMSNDFNISEKTQIFIGTLFIILGAITCAENNITCMSFIIKGIKNIKRKELLFKSKLIREYESDIWDKEIENSKQHINQFYKKISNK